MAASEPENSGGPPGAFVVTAPRAPAPLERRKFSARKRIKAVLP
jgi:hypothetical protein